MTRRTVFRHIADIGDDNMSEHWEMDMWKSLFGRLTIVFVILQAIFTYWIWDNEDFGTKFGLSLFIFLPEYLICLVTYHRARDHEKERIAQERKQDNLPV